MVILEKVRILYKEYKIEQEGNLHDIYGQIHYLDEKILLNSDSSEEQKKATLIHELIHGMDEMYKMGLSEEQVEKLGNAFYMMLRDNLDMFEGSDIS